MNRNARSRSEDSARLKDETGAVAGIITVNYAANGKVGIFHWTNVGYDSGLRWGRSSRFYAERGRGLTHGTYNEPVTELTSIGPDSHGPRPLVIQRELERCDGGALKCIRALTGDSDLPVVEWHNPFAQREDGYNPEWHDDEIGVAGCIQSLLDAIRNGTAPTLCVRESLHAAENSLHLCLLGKSAHLVVSGALAGIRCGLEHEGKDVHVSDSVQEQVWLPEHPRNGGMNFFLLFKGLIPARTCTITRPWHTRD